MMFSIGASIIHPLLHMFRGCADECKLLFPSILRVCTTNTRASGSLIDPSWFTLETSRGIETYDSKLFMRATVVAFDMMVYIPALYAFTRIWHRTRSSRTQVLVPLIMIIAYRSTELR